MTKYPPLTQYMQKGCRKQLMLWLFYPNFIGQATCEYVVDPMKKIHRILGIQEKIEL